MRHRISDLDAVGSLLQFLRELHFIEALNCLLFTRSSYSLQFLRELHFIEAGPTRSRGDARGKLQFLRELHFIEASQRFP